MKIYELLFGALSVVSFILAFRFEDRLDRISAVFAGFLILIVVYLSSYMKDIKETAESSSSEIKKLEEKVKIYERIAEHNVRIKNLEKGGKK
ncbi:MAG: hypothetical protein KKG75_00500 [Nanoarchaeota archaeon]|nr:hypothetical protein [Nanoarchaeota archaeon]